MRREMSLQTMPPSRHSYTLRHTQPPLALNTATASYRAGTVAGQTRNKSVNETTLSTISTAMNDHNPRSDSHSNTSPTEDGATITYHDVVYSVHVRHKCCASFPKHIIKGLSGHFKPGMNAIMGATGSGKTSLLDIMAKRKNPNGLEGSILVDGNEQPENFKCMSGYVVQDDVVMGTLTVKENFLFSANLRLPSSVGRHDRERCVDAVINELGLSEVANAKVGNEFIRGISGGERKRTNIGMELITTPRVLFLDEPTTGLDASTANAVMLMLKRMARKGRTIIFSIHQPRYSIFRLFDHLTLLSQGLMVYQGPAQQALDYFSTIGFECEPHNNPADFFLDVINGDSTAVNMAKTGAMDDDNTETDIEVGRPPSPELEDELAVDLSNKYKASQWYRGMMAEVEPVVQVYEQAVREGNLQIAAMDGGDYAVSFFIQLFVVSKRAVLNIVRNPQTSIMQVFVMVIFALLVGIIYFQMELDFAGLQNRIGAFFFIVMNQVFGNLSAVELFIKERKIFIHENSNGFYRVSAYFLAKLFCDVIPMRILPIMVFSVIVYFMIGLQIDVGKFFTFLLILSCVSLSASALGFFFSATVRVFALANLCIALCYVFMMVFSGLLVNLNSMLSWLSWIKWFSIFRYGMNALYVNELTELVFCGFKPNATGIPVYKCEKGTTYLDEQKIPYGEPFDLWSNIVALISMTVILLTLTYIQLRRVNKYS